MCEMLRQRNILSFASEEKAGVMREREFCQNYFLLFSLGETHGNTSTRYTDIYLCESHLHKITA